MESTTRINSPASLQVMKGTLADSHPNWLGNASPRPFIWQQRLHCGTMTYLMLGLPGQLRGSSGRVYTHCCTAGTRHSAWHMVGLNKYSTQQPEWLFQWLHLTVSLPFLKPTNGHPGMPHSLALAHSSRWTSCRCWHVFRLKRLLRSLCSPSAFLAQALHVCCFFCPKFSPHLLSPDYLHFFFKSQPEALAHGSHLSPQVQIKPLLICTLIVANTSSSWHCLEL